jgi:1-deoxy-D-xylulose-5-phosphate reductoisomerase
MIGITLLGSTGSIGNSSLDVIARHPQRYQVVALTANSDVATMLQQCQHWQPQFAVMSDADAATQLQQQLKDSATEVLSGLEGLQHVARLPQIEIVIAGIVGAAGLLPTLAAAEAGKRILLANKEALVMSGHLFMDTAHANGAEILPVDSEHNAIFQCLPTREPGHDAAHAYTGVEKILLTASGGPFRTFEPEQLKKVTPEQAIAHPNWDMGRKISVDSATMMNKGLEVIEARWLFDVPVENIEVVVHPQSVVHSMVSYSDGSVLAQLGNPDMRTPIANALAWPDRINSGVEPLDIFEVATLDFEKPDMQRFPCLALCFEAVRRGGSASIVLNAANEIAVQSFLDNRIAYTDIASTIEQTLQRSEITDEVDSIEQILLADNDARAIATTITKQIASS